jgi:hypothetical protein
VPFSSKIPRSPQPRQNDERRKRFVNLFCEFARGIAQHLTRGAFSKDPVSDDRVAENVALCLLKFGGEFERDCKGEFAQFVAITKGSIGETRAQLIYRSTVGI